MLLDELKLFDEQSLFEHEAALSIKICDTNGFLCKLLGFAEELFSFGIVKIIACKAARQLGMHRNTLSRKVTQYKLDHRRGRVR